MEQKKENKEQGFTLIELMIVVAIIGILAAIAVPQFAAYRTRSYNANSKALNKNFAAGQANLNAELGAYGETTNSVNTLSDLVVDLRGAANIASSNSVTGLTTEATANVAASRIQGTNGLSGKTFAVPLGLGTNMVVLANTPAGQGQPNNTSTSYIIITRHIKGDTAYGADSDNADRLNSVSNPNWIGSDGLSAFSVPAITGHDGFRQDLGNNPANIPGNGAPGPNWTMIH